MPAPACSRLLGIVLIVMLLLAACAQASPPSPTPGDAPPILQQDNHASSDKRTTVEAWAPVGRFVGWRATGLEEAARLVTNEPLALRVTRFNALTENYAEKFEAAARSGQGPDIAFAASAAQLQAWAEAGYLAPMEPCIKSYPEFDNIVESLWPVGVWRDQQWGVPFEVNLEVLYYTKPKLRQLGWTDEQIENLPDQIRQGRFTLDDLLATAREAVDKGIVEPGFGFWPNLYDGKDFLQPYLAYGGQMLDSARQQLVIDQAAAEKAYAFRHRLDQDRLTLPPLIRLEQHSWSSALMWRDAVMQGRVLFWNDFHGWWSVWAADHVADRGGQAYLFENFGVALLPSGLPDQSGYAIVRNVGFLVITSASVSGRKQQAAACALLAKTLTPDINAAHEAASSALGVLKPSAYNQRSRLGRLLSYMLDYAWFPPRDAGYEKYREIVVDFMGQVDSGAMPPAEAASAAINQLKRELGDSLIVK